MSTNLTLSKEEIKLLLFTVLKTRGFLFNCIEMKFDKRSPEKPSYTCPIWQGERGTFPLLKEIDDILALLRLHINSEETIQFYEMLGFYDQPCKKKINK